MEKIEVYRNENKYFIDQINTLQLIKKMDLILKRDNFSLHNAYKIRSLYFDSINNKDFSTKLAGTEIRTKIRIRTYDIDNNYCKLELKKKSGNYQHKISLWIEKNDAIELSKMNYSVLTKYFDDDVAIDIYKEMQLGCYRPVVMIEYDRIAFIHELYNTRLTFDMNIKSSETCFDLFEKNVNYDVILNDFNILEVKYDEILLEYISKILKQYNLNKISISKYCMGRKIYYDFDY